MVTLLELKTQARERADMKKSRFIEEDELRSMLNASAADLYDILVSRFEDYYIAEVPFTLLGGEESYPLPTAFYKLKGLDKDDGGKWRTVRPFQFTERNDDDDPLISAGVDVRYRVFGNTLRLSPVTNVQGSYRLWYVPRFTPMILDTDTIDGVNGWEEYVIVDTVIKMLAKEESNTSAFERQRANLKQRIEAMAADRDAAEPQYIIDVSEVNYNQRRVF